MKILLFSISVLILIIGCDSKQADINKSSDLTDGNSTLFSKISEKESDLAFTNHIEQTLDFNFLNYPYIYIGAGLAVGDLDNDDLEDVYFVSSFGENKLYKNEGDFTFKDVTAHSKTGDDEGFSTGVSLLDINNDGWLDIYVCKAGSLKNDQTRKNKLYINQQDGTFKNEAAKWGLDDAGYSTQAYTIDYDKDGDLDLYVVNHRYDFQNNGKISTEIQRTIEEYTTDQLYRNDGDTFKRVTGEAGLYNKAWGLSAVISDFNGDGWEDIYVANDFLEPDAMYINQQDGTFKNEILNRTNHISFNSMGSDFADLNNDLSPDLLVVDMLAENYARSKENMASMSTSNFMSMVDVGYHHAYMANMLQYNTGDGHFKETGQFSGVVKTDWSWAPLIADLDNDGYKDIYISNGVYKDYTNQDFRRNIKALNEQGEAMSLDAVVNMLPAEKLNNYAYKNNKDLTFTKSITEWGLDDPSFSNGAAYADLDNDGDLDLVTNNIDGEAGLYRNNSTQNFIQVALKGSKNNNLGIGAKVYVESDEGTQLSEQYITRGYESSVSPILHFGLGKTSSIKKISVQWPDGLISEIENPKANQKITIDHQKASKGQLSFNSIHPKKENLDPTQVGITYKQEENKFNDYDLQLLIPQKQSTKGTGIVKADLNGDGLDDFFVGNSAGAEAAMYLQQTDGTFNKINEALWKRESAFEDAGALFFDADGDGDQDLYVVSAGYELSENNALLQDRLYENDGDGTFSKTNKLPKMLISGKSVTAGDYDNDGDLDLFVGGNVVPGKYPINPRSFLLKNENGSFVDTTPQNNDLAEIGMISKALFTDYDSDSDLDLMVVGEWMAPTFYNNTNGSFTKAQTTGLDNTEGWWFGLTAADYDGDGDQDYMLGNIGKNNKFQPKEDKPLYIYAKDFDSNGTFDVAMSKINNGKLVPVRGKECSSEQNPFLLDKIETYKEFASLEFKDIYGEEKLEGAFKATVYMFESAYAENLGDGNFKIHKLPNPAQLGPTLAFVNQDFNGDGHLDVMGVGAIYDAEVETIRYDSNFGYVLLGDGTGKFVYDKKYDPSIHSDAKDITPISIQNKGYYMVVSNNAPLEIFSLKP